MLVLIACFYFSVKSCREILGVDNEHFFVRSSCFDGFVVLK